MLPATESIFENNLIAVQEQKDALDQKKAIIRMVKRMTTSFFRDTDVVFESHYQSWGIESALNGVELPAFEVCKTELNDQPCGELRFVTFFFNHFNI